MMNPMKSVSRLEKSDRTNTSTDSVQQRECLIGIQNSGRLLSTLDPSPNIFCYVNIFFSVSKNSSRALHKPTIKPKCTKIIRKTLPKSGFAFECRYLWCQADTLKSTGQESFHNFICETEPIFREWGTFWFCLLFLTFGKLFLCILAVSYVPILRQHRCYSHCSWIALLQHSDHTLNFVW